MSSNSEPKSICKSIYTEAGFSGIVMVLRMFPERLHEEMLEELSMNMYEWESKLLPHEKRDLELNIDSHADSFSVQDEEAFTALNNTLDLLSHEVKKTEENMKNNLSRMEEFPSILAETDIDCIGIMNEQLENVRRRKQNIRDHIDHFDENTKKKIERSLDDLFQ